VLLRVTGHEVRRPVADQHEIVHQILDSTDYDQRYRVTRLGKQVNGYGSLGRVATGTSGSFRPGVDPGANPWGVVSICGG
jgi:hypothetical protein